MPISKMITITRHEVVMISEARNHVIDAWLGHSSEGSSEGIPTEIIINCIASKGILSEVQRIDKACEYALSKKPFNVKKHVRESLTP